MSGRTTGVTGRRAKGKAREELVMDAAAKAIAELGLANVRVSDIAERAGMTPGHVTYYFPSKTELLMLSIRQSEEALVEQVEAELDGIADPWTRLERLIDLSASNGRGDPGWILWFQVWSDAATDDTVAEVHNELDDRWRQILISVLEYGRERGDFAFDDLDVIAELISATIDGLSIQLTVGAPHLDRDRMLEMCARASAALLAAPAPIDAA
ncbi:TetR family transcriptional regulator [Agromyces sp. SYSU K20354]|uniref:TetR/AcrR family transcriptional regulator n=1 Tax=Agromyces cavernae TaxID=2898659 RepID=UPI001E60D068|nr:TetR/AcrR family transcriptional regulator [Agromyces cavernae]MCD2442522.1 TetR family transcriptional regulator [Agromyces cavernae]